MRNVSSFNKILADEKAAIAAITDTTEAALAGAAHLWKRSALQGEKGASKELIAAEKALQEYRKSKEIAAEEAAKDFGKRKEEAQTVRAEELAKIEQMNAEKMKRKLSTDWADREEVYSVWAGLVGDLHTALIHNAGVVVNQLISACNGDINKSSKVTELVTETINESFNEIAMKSKIEGCFYNDEDEDD